ALRAAVWSPSIAFAMTATLFAPPTSLGSCSDRSPIRNEERYRRIRHHDAIDGVQRVAASAARGPRTLASRLASATPEPPLGRDGLRQAGIMTASSTTVPALLGMSFARAKGVSRCC